MPSFNLFSDKQPSAGKTAAILAVYAMALLMGVHHHELGLDEAHQFLLGLWSNSVPELLFNARYDGHPVFWNLLLFIVTRFSSDPVCMQILNVGLCSIAVGVFLRYAPFSLLFKLLFISGYLMIYEYSVISRDYGLGCLWFFVVLAIYPYRGDKRLLFALAIAVLANTHLFGTVIGIALLVQMLLVYFLGEEKQKRGEIFFASCIMVLGIGIAFWQVLPPANDFHFLYSSQPFHYVEQARKVYATPFRGMFNLPDIYTYYSWNTNLFTDRCWSVSRLFLPLPFALAFILLCRKPFTLLFLVLSVSGIMLIEYFVLLTDTRHNGFIYLCFITALWMGNYELENFWVKKITWLDGTMRVFLKPAEILVWLALLLQVISAGVLYAKDFNQPFNGSKETSSYLVEHSLQHNFTMVSNQTLGPAVSAYLRRSVYHTEAEREATFCYWNILPWTINDSTLLARVDGQLVQHDSIILLLDHPLPEPVNPTCKIILLKAFDNAFVKSGNYWVYLVARKKP